MTTENGNDAADGNGNGHDHGNGPEGYELRGNLSFGRLNPLAGKLARKTETPQLCGWITGMAYGYQEGTGAFGKFNRIIGEFFAIPWNRSAEINATEMFLPGVAERFVLAALNANPNGVPIRMEGWAYPDESGRESATGYVYRVFLRSPPGAISKARQMAVECGIVDPMPQPPPVALPDYDRETGEIREAGDHDADHGGTPHDDNPAEAEERRMKGQLDQLSGLTPRPRQRQGARTAAE